MFTKKPKDPDGQPLQRICFCEDMWHWFENALHGTSSVGGWYGGSHDCPIKKTVELEWFDHGAIHFFKRLDLVLVTDDIFGEQVSNEPQTVGA